MLTISRLFRVLVLAFVFSSSVHGLTVNRLNGGTNIIYIDFSLPGNVIPLELVRSYNSITSLNENSGWLGAFGWGWTSAFETTLTTTPERYVILRDGSTGNTIFFRPQKEDPKVREAFFESLRVAFHERKLGRALTPEEKRKVQLPDKVLTRLKTDQAFRAEMAAKYDIHTQVPTGELLVSAEYGYQTISFKNNQWVREKDGIVQHFDKDGRMTRQIDKNGFYFDYKYTAGPKGQLAEISDQDRTMSLKFVWRQDKVVEVTDNRNHRARYTYDNTGNLIQVIDSNNQTFYYKYENKKFPHLLSRIEYPSESTNKEKIFREIRYDDSGLVMYQRDRDGAETNYSYGKGTSDPENNFWTKSIRKSKGITEEQYDEFFIKVKSDGTRYLAKQENRLNGVSTTTVFTPCCGKPAQVTKNGEVTTYKYNDNGLLEEKIGPKEEVKIEYDRIWNKVARVSQNGFISKYEYDKKGNLVKASNTKNQSVALKYDRFGRILNMLDQDKRQISFRYGDNGKPVQIEEIGVGSIRIEYNPEGKIVKTETLLEKGKGRRPSEAQSQEVVKRVMKGFQTLLDIIRPAGIGFTI